MKRETKRIMIVAAAALAMVAAGEGIVRRDGLAEHSSAIKASNGRDGTRKVQTAISGVRPVKDPAKLAEFIRKTGGLMRKPGSNSGKVAFVNSQKRYALGELEAVAERIGTSYRIAIEAKEGDFSGIGSAAESIKKAGGTAGVVVAEVDASFPALMVFPDERCAIVNVAAFPKGADAALLRKQVVRGFAAAAGAMESQIMPTLMSAFENQKKLSVFPGEEIPADVGIRMKNALRLAGVTPYVVTTYKHACREGWAPAPTNDIQKAIWDEVRQLPTKPLKIEFDPKRGK